jgi:hypothetical protein
MTNRVIQEKAYAYLTGGRATVTFHNTITNNQFTFTIARQRLGDNVQVNGASFWVTVCDDLIGYIRGDVFIKYTKDPNVPFVRADATNAFANMWKRIMFQQVPDTVHILHDGNCSYCNRPLTDAISIEYGLGPICRKKLGIVVPKQSVS